MSFKRHPFKKAGQGEKGGNDLYIKAPTEKHSFHFVNEDLLENPLGLQGRLSPMSQVAWIQILVLLLIG